MKMLKLENREVTSFVTTAHTARGRGNGARRRQAGLRADSAVPLGYGR
jgi:hypothetical protein